VIFQPDPASDAFSDPHGKMPISNDVTNALLHPVILCEQRACHEGNLLIIMAYPRIREMGPGTGCSSNG